MNPKITIAVDSKNKAVASITGMLTVGSKVDVEITGITYTDVPEYGPDDKFVGRSLRLRIVDEMGRDLARYPLVEKDTSTTPVTENDKWDVDTSNSKFTNATGSVLDMDTDMLRMAFRCIPFNEQMEFGIILDSVVDSAQYAIGKVNVKQWSIASTEDPTVLPDWRETLADLKDGLASVEASKTAAAASATAASQSAESASGSAAQASGSATSASTSAINAAETIKHYPKVGANGNWYVWNPTNSQWEDSGKGACGYASWFYDETDHKYHKVVVSKTTSGEYVIAVDQNGENSPTEDHYVDLISNQNVAGTKTFSSDIIGHCTQDAKDSEVVKIAGSQSITGYKTFYRNGEVDAFEIKNGNNATYPGMCRFKITGTDGKWRTIVGSYDHIADIDTSGNASVLYSQTVNNGVEIGSAYIAVVQRDVGSRYVKTNANYVRGSAFAEAGMPVYSFVDLTQPASGSYLSFPTFIAGVTSIYAQQNGYVYICGTATDNGWVRLDVQYSNNTSTIVSSICNFIGDKCLCYVPVKNGYKVQLTYNNFTTSKLAFFRASAEI